MQIRRLNDRGIQRMEVFLDSLTTEMPMAYPESILTDPSTAEGLPFCIEVERRDFQRRYDAAEYIYTKFASSGLSEPERDAGLWAWLALYWFEQLCPRGSAGSYKVGERSRWIPRLDSARRYYRHLLLGPYLIYAAHADAPQRACCVLIQSLARPGDVVEQIASRPQLVTCKAVLGAATAMYCSDNGGLRRGAGGKGPGSARRLGDVIMQFDRTFDLHALDAQDLLTLLPAEFDRFRREPKPS